MTWSRSGTWLIGILSRRTCAEAHVEPSHARLREAGTGNGERGTGPQGDPVSLSLACGLGSRRALRCLTLLFPVPRSLFPALQPCASTASSTRDEYTSAAPAFLATATPSASPISSRVSSEQRLVGKKCVCKCVYRWWPH